MPSVQTSGSLRISVLVGVLLLGGVTLAGAQGSSPIKPFCGNGSIESNFGEQCDSQNLGGATCQSQGFDGGQLRCNACRYDTSQCFDTVCGDGVAQGTEPCDGNDLGGKTCATEGFSGGSLACKEDCTVDTAGCTSAPTTCTPPANGWYDPSKLYGMGSGPADVLYCEPEDILIDGLTSCMDPGFWFSGSSYASRIVPPEGHSTCGKYADPTCPTDAPCRDGASCGVCCLREQGYQGRCTNANGDAGRASLSVRCLKH